MKEKYLLQDYIYWLEQLTDTYLEAYTKEEIASMVAEALINFLPYVDKKKS